MLALGITILTLETNSGVWSAVGGTAKAATTPGSPSPGTGAQKQAPGGPSVLMDILRASVQPQAQEGQAAPGIPP